MAGFDAGNGNDATTLTFFIFALDLERALSWYIGLRQEGYDKMTATATQRTYSVQETAARTGLSEHTLRYYERAGLIAPVQRDDSSKHRRYSEDHLRAIDFLKRMRATGMHICDMQRYVALFQQGDATLGERLAMLEEHGQRVREQIAELQSHLEVIEFKISNYRRLGAERDWDADQCLEIRKGSRE